jgi:hypothetical protein
MKPVTVSAVIRNFSSAAISNPVAYRINGGEVVQKNQHQLLLHYCYYYY